MADVFLYRGETNPPDVRLRPEGVTLDKYHQQHHNPTRRVAAVAVFAASLFFVPVVQGETITVDKWYQPASEPVRARPVQQPAGEFRFELPRTILLTDWWQQPSEPVRRKVINPLGGEVRPDPVVPRMDSWFKETQQPYFTKRRDSNTGESRFEIPRNILLSDWWQQATEPVRQKLRQVFGGDFRTEVVSGAETITLDKWWQQTSEPVRRKTIYPLGGEFRFEVPRAILLSDWWQEISQPYFAKRRDPNTGEFRYELPRAILLTDWFREIVQPYFTKRPDPNTGEFRYELPRDILLSDWWLQASDLVRTRLIQTLGGEFRTDVVSTEIITLDKWFREVIQPYFTRRTDANTGEVQVLDQDLFPPPPPPEIPNIVVPEETAGGSRPGTIPSLIDLRKEDDEILEIIKSFMEWL